MPRLFQLESRLPNLRRPVFPRRRVSPRRWLEQGSSWGGLLCAGSIALACSAGSAGGDSGPGGESGDSSGSLTAKQKLDLACREQCALSNACQVFQSDCERLCLSIVSFALDSACVDEALVESECVVDRFSCDSLVCETQRDASLRCARTYCAAHSDHAYCIENGLNP